MTDTMRLSYSVAKTLLNQSPLHAWTNHRLGGGVDREASEAMTDGKILDRIMFGVGPEIEIIDAGDFKTKAAKELRDMAESLGRMPVLTHRYLAMESMTAVWRARLGDMGIVLRGQSQVRMEWNSDGVDCSGVIDHLVIDRSSATILDLKTCQDASLKAATRSIASYDYDIQHAAYVEAVETLFPELAGRTAFLFLFCEKFDPFAVSKIELAGTFRQLGRLKWEKAKSVWRECMATGVWPGYPAFAMSAEASGWQINKAIEEGMNVDSEAS